jgi:hypothetical protein
MNFVKYLYLLLIPIMWAHAQNTIQVPADYSNIQDAINASETGDTILVGKGTYVENINFMGKNIFLSSYFYLTRDKMFIDSTIIDGSNPAHPDTGSVVIFRNGETRDAVLQGFTITGEQEPGIIIQQKIYISGPGEESLLTMLPHPLSTITLHIMNVLIIPTLRAPAGVVSGLVSPRL